MTLPSDRSEAGGQEAVDLIANRDLAEWVVTTCLMFGATVSTAYQVAGLFVQGRADNPDAIPVYRGEVKP